MHWQLQSKTFRLMFAIGDPHGGCCFGKFREKIFRRNELWRQSILAGRVLAPIDQSPVAGG